MKLFFILLFVLSGCQKNVESDYIDMSYDCVEVQDFYTQSVEPILAQNCVMYHTEYDSFGGPVTAIMDGNVIERVNLNISNPFFMLLGGVKLSIQELDIIQNFSELFCQ
tara:strand:- start:342 stop:668 length:327 start_codon:yes stop_codon:yes gene_type:complete